MTLKFYQVKRPLPLFNSTFFKFSIFNSPSLFSYLFKLSPNLQTIVLPNLNDSTFKISPYILPEWPTGNVNIFANPHAYPNIDFSDNRLYAAFNQLNTLSEPLLTKLLKDYQRFKYPKCADKNPTDITNSFYEWVIKYNLSAAETGSLIIDCDDASHKLERPSLWSQARVGQSRTQLANGRIILIGGEYDYPPNYYNYNDVSIIYLNGKVEIYNYPYNIFTCPESHTATRVSTGDDEHIVIIGSDNAYTSVYKLNTYNFEIEKLATRNSMGWICKHNARLRDNQIIISGGEVHIEDTSIFIENIDTWTLNLKTLIWKNVTNNQRHWQHFYVARQDYDSVHLQSYHTLDCFLKLKELELAENELKLFQKYLNITPDIDSYRQLFRPPIDHEVIADADSKQHLIEYNKDIIFDDYKNQILYIDGIKVRYKANLYHIEVIIEGKLSEDKLELLKQNLRHKLSKVENMACEVIEI